MVRAVDAAAGAAVRKRAHAPPPRTHGDEIDGVSDGVVDAQHQCARHTRRQLERAVLQAVQHERAVTAERVTAAHVNHLPLGNVAHGHQKVR